STTPWFGGWLRADAAADDAAPLRGALVETASTRRAGCRSPTTSTPGKDRGKSVLTTETSFMNGNWRTDGDGATPLGTFAAELTVAAYPVALEHGMADSWVDLEIDLWMVLAETAKGWGREGSRATCPGGYEAWRECFLAAMTDAAYRT